MLYGRATAPTAKARVPQRACNALLAARGPCDARDTMAFRLGDPLGSSRVNVIRSAWDRLEHVPGGKRVFSRLVGLAAPYTGTIDAQVEVLRRGHAEVSMRDRRGVRNHLQCVHAIALVNLAELAGNVALAYALPDDARFIVAGLSIEYVKKARGTIRGVCDVPVPPNSERREYAVPVSLRNDDGEEVAHAVLRTLVGPKRGG
jgi:acyl-coenzyme A thioesterase PaaI-like protein